MPYFPFSQEGEAEAEEAAVREEAEAAHRAVEEPAGAGETKKSGGIPALFYYLIPVTQTVNTGRASLYEMEMEWNPAASISALITCPRFLVIVSSAPSSLG